MAMEASARAPLLPEYDAELVGAAETLVLMANSGGDFNIHNPPTAMHTATNAGAAPSDSARRPRGAPPRRNSYSCNECGKVFDSYQALGGHKSSHRDRVKHRVAAAVSVAAAPKPVEKVYVCHVCSMEFKIGQALGGHMRKHYEPPPTNAADREKIQLGIAGDNTGESFSGGASSQEAVGKTTDFNVAPNLETCLDRSNAILKKGL